MPEEAERVWLKGLPREEHPGGSHAEGFLGGRAIKVFCAGRTLALAATVEEEGRE